MRIDRLKFCTELMKRDWTFKKLSEESNVSRQTISFIKNGKNCTDATGIKIAKALGIDIKEILE